MSRFETPLTLVLDCRMALDAVMAQRYHRLPPSRRAGWAKQLLLLGFQVECRTLDAAQRRPVAEPVENRLSSAYSRWLCGVERAGAVAVNPEQESAAPAQCRSPVTAVTAEDSRPSKPFAALRQVIGT